MSMAAGTPESNNLNDVDVPAGSAWQRLVIVALLIAASVLFWERMRVPVIFIATLGVLIYVHELGHFLAARWAGVRVYEFALGFGPRMVTYLRRNGTDFTIRWVPLGGFVSMKGMEPDEEATPDGLNGKPAFQRAVVYLAGPVMNLILAVVIFCSAGSVFGWIEEAGVKVGKVEPASAAEKMGLKSKDLVVSINGQAVKEAQVFIDAIQASKGTPVTVRVNRGGQNLDLTGTPTLRTDNGRQRYVLGFGLDAQYQSGPRMSLDASVRRGFEVLGAYFTGLYNLVRTSEIFNRVGSVGTVYRVTSETATMPPTAHFSVMAELSLSLFIFNLLPIPVLDGGHLLLLAVEVIRRRKLRPEAQRAAQMVGLLVIGTIFVLLLYKDALGFR